MAAARQSGGQRTAAKRTAAKRAAKRQLGLVPLEVWVPPDGAEEIRELEGLLCARHERCAILGPEFGDSDA